MLIFTIKVSLSIPSFNYLHNFYILWRQNIFCLCKVVRNFLRYHLKISSRDIKCELLTKNVKCELLT